jgi:hypothetical protein
MKIKIDDFRIDSAEPAEATLDFQTLCAQLAASQAETATARLARDSDSTDQADHANPAIAVLRGVPGQSVSGPGAHGSFHAAAAARVPDKSES